MGIETAVWRALAVFRLLGLLYAVAVYVRRVDEYSHPVGGWVVLGLMAAWTVATYLIYARPSGRTWPVLVLDLAIAVAAVVSSRWLDDIDRVQEGAQTLPVVWAAAPVLAFAIRGGWPAGVGAALVLGAADLVHRGAMTVPTANNIVLLLLAGAVVGYTVSLARRGELALARALAVQAAADGRLGVALSIEGRLRELGGTMAVESAPGAGTEVEMRVPR